MSVGSYTLPSFGSPILWNYDFRHILAGELDLARYREKTEPYYRGETWIRPPFLDHAEDSEASTDVGSDSETMAGDSNSETEGYVEGDVPVHAHPRPRWSSSFYEDCSPFGIRPPRTPSPPPLQTTEALTHIYTRAELEYHGFEAHLNWQGYVFAHL
jgi:hypothetical protein